MLLAWVRQRARADAPYGKFVLPTALTWYDIISLDRRSNKMLVKLKMVALGLPH